ncbi:methyltransferase [Obelidium mucronatum]|nr:methyltransferase [Obelidium mucronatum]
MTGPSAAISTTYDWSPTAYKQNASFVPQLGAPILSALAAQPGERILDLGCGDGVLTEKIIETGAIVVGTDASPDMIRQARENNPNSTYLVMDGHALNESEWASVPDSDKFDAVFSNAALHWMKNNPPQVVAGVRSILKSNGNGRFVAEFGGFLNVGTVHAALINGLDKRGYNGKSVSPWFFPSPQDYRQILEENGFTDVQIAHVGRPTALPETGLKGWLDTFAMAFMDVLPTEEEEKEAFKLEIVEQLRPVCCDARGNWYLDYWRLRIDARTTTTAKDD